MAGAAVAIALALALGAASCDGTGAPGGGAGALGGVETVVGGLQVPWGLAFATPTTILVTERPGRVRVVEDGVLRPRPVAEIGVVARGEGGLLGIALHPRFPEERYAYLYYTAPGGNRVVRHHLGADLSFGAEEVLLDGIPAARVHNGGRIAFGPDGLLYVATGDAGQPRLAADLGSLAGKILRLRADGTVPADNPVEGSPVWSYGHRNPQGLDWDDDGNLYASEHGPSGDLGLCCHDEVNLIEPGRFYGWPFLAGHARAAGGEPPVAPTPPVATSGEGTWAPSGLAVRDTGAGAELLVANLAGAQLLRFVVSGDDPGAVGPAEVAVEGFGRLRSAVEGPDGCVYLTTSNTDGRGRRAADDDRILRSCPATSNGGGDV